MKCADRLALVLLLGACASTANPATESGTSANARYPRRSAGCELAVYETPVPGVVAWDDLGIAEAICHINDGVNECVRRLKAEACRMGGDILYNVPRKPFRPRDQVLVYRGQVAHSRSKAVHKEEDPDMPPPASAEEASGPVVPLPSGAAPAPAPAPDAAPDAGVKVPAPPPSSDKP